MKNAPPNFKVIALLAVLLSCGPEYIPYDKPTDESKDPPSQQCQDAFSAVQKAIDQSCSQSSCHGKSVPQMVLLSGEDHAENNRANLEAYTGTTAEKLYGKIGPNGSHGGGDQSSILPKSTIESWLAACL